MACSNCGATSSTRYVALYEIKAEIYWRYTKHIKGQLCKNCIYYYYWLYTWNTFNRGWWGLHSWFITPIVLLNNTYYYLLSLALK
jgi:hypothetical protein